MSVLSPTSICRKCKAPLWDDGTDGFCTLCLFKPIALPLTAMGHSKQTSAGPHEEIPEPHQFGGYELIAKIARGGMGVVYKARDLRANRIVALKMVAGGHFAGDAEMKRFCTEAKSVASLDHPNIVPLYEVGEVDKHPFFTMKLIEGGSLAGKIFKDSLVLDQRDSARLIAKVAEAIHHAHQRGILHRDLKPANILLDRDGEPFVTDFGIARRLEEDSDLTRTGVVMGTPNYMSPEQAAGKTREVTTASDIYSLGAILYHLLTGKPPFAAETPLETIRHVLDQEPARPSSINCKADSDLETICLKCLEKGPQNRYGSAAALAEDLHRWLRNETIIARRATSGERLVKWVRRKPLVASLLAVIALAVVIGTVGIFFQWKEAEMARRVAERKTKEAEQRTLEAQEQREVAERARRNTETMLTRFELEKADLQLSQGNSAGGLAYFARVLRREPTNVIAASRIMSFLRHRPVALAETLLPGFDGRVMNFSLNPDQTQVVGTIDQEKDNLRIWDLRPGAPSLPAATLPLDLPQIMGGSPITMRMPGVGRGPMAAMRGPMMGQIPSGLNIVPLRAQFSADGKLIISGSNSGEVRVWDAASGLPVTSVLKQDFVQGIGVTPDGKSAVAIGRTGIVTVWDIKSGKLLHRFETQPPVGLAMFNPGLSRVLAITVVGETRVWDINTGKPVGDSLDILGPAKDIAWSNDGNMTAIATGTTAYFLKLNDGESAGGWGKIEHPSTVTALAFTADGQMIASASEDQIARLWNTRNSELLVSLKHPDTVTTAVFSDDATQLATAARDKAVRLWDTATGRLLCEPLMHQSTVLSIHFTTDHRGVIVLCRDGSVFRYTLVNPPVSASILTDKTEDGTKENTPSREGNEANPPLPTGSLNALASFSPDGNRVLITENDLVRLWEIKNPSLLQTFPHGAPIISAEFSPDGSRILTAGKDSQVKIWDTTSGQLLTKPIQPSARLLSAQFSPDGEQVWALVGLGMGGIWSTRTGEPISAERQGTMLENGVFSPDGKVVLGTFGLARGASLHNFATAERLGAFMKHDDRISGCGFSPDGLKVITASVDSTARIWDARTGKPLTDPLRHEGAVHLATFSPDGHQAVTVSQDRTARLWNMAEGASLVHTLLHPAAVRYAEFSRDNLRLLTVADDASVHLWDTQLGQRLVDPFYLNTRVTSARLSPDGQSIVARDEHGNGQLWSVPSLPLPAPVWLADLAEFIGGQRIDDDGLTQPASRDGAILRKTLLHNTTPGAYATKLHWLFAHTK